jgi:hypothetical protein
MGQKIAIFQIWVFDFAEKNIYFFSNLFEIFCVLGFGKKNFFTQISDFLKIGVFTQKMFIKNLQISITFDLLNRFSSSIPFWKGL